MRKPRIVPVASSTWGDFEKLFSAKGAPHYCWCSVSRFNDAHDLEKADKRDAMRALVHAGVPIGVLAYQGDEPIGWCSVAPRESYVKLARSKTMPRVTISSGLPSRASGAFSAMLASTGWGTAAIMGVSIAAHGDGRDARQRCGGVAGRQAHARPRAQRQAQAARVGAIGRSTPAQPDCVL